ncbi:hypothetical protein AYL99_11780 [Fonsecaea erecta]|uniref:Serine/threonine-protein kinase ATG1 n=1 Tax=Fonsecaea erecta TaxID=1367422 RepID=A0A178Z2M6_9EURO|nr:hypothetical protein AYL99_11780 [Fonsecaea erecta]OAP54020.1 hypothetical protein AYL99_11780 [Fonsecaea erecta]
MATNSDEDLPNIVLLFSDIVGPDEIPELSENARYEFSPSKGNENTLANWSRNQPEEPTPPFLALVFGKHMYSPQGWVFGSSDDTDVCDVQLAKDNTTGISRQHFRIDISPSSNCPRLTNLSNKLIKLYVDGMELPRAKGQSEDIPSSVTIHVGEVTMKAWRPTLSHQEEICYRRNAERFSAEILDSLPRAIGPNATQTSTVIVRFGSNNTVYRREDEAAVGTGSFASVMKVKELGSKKIFAAKVPHHKLSDPASTARKRWESLTAEFQNIVELQHPYIVQAIEVLTGEKASDPPWLIMEWIEDDLSSIELDNRDSHTVLTHVSKGLAYIHAKGFTHRDLKPENVLVQLKNHRLLAAKIADFGTTKYDPSGQMQTYTGTSVYMAPEFWESRLAYSNAVDMWSLGVMAVELLTSMETRLHGWCGVFPPTRDQHHNWIQEVLWPRAADAPHEAKELLLGLLCKTAADRWSAAVCDKWLQEHDIQATGGSKKRPLSLSSQNAAELERGLQRSDDTLRLTTFRAGTIQHPCRAPNPTGEMASVEDQVSSPSGTTASAGLV